MSRSFANSHIKMVKVKMNIQWEVLSPDGIHIWSLYYDSEKQAKAALKRWMSQYKQQGYYSSSKGRIALADLEDSCTIQKVK